MKRTVRTRFMEPVLPWIGPPGMGEVRLCARPNENNSEPVAAEISANKSIGSRATDASTQYRVLSTQWPRGKDRAPSTGWLLVTGYWVLGTGYWVLDRGFASRSAPVASAFTRCSGNADMRLTIERSSTG